MNHTLKKKINFVFLDTDGLKAMLNISFSMLQETCIDII